MINFRIASALVPIVFETGYARRTPISYHCFFLKCSTSSRAGRAPQRSLLKPPSLLDTEDGRQELVRDATVRRSARCPSEPGDKPRHFLRPTATGVVLCLFPPFFVCLWCSTHEAGACILHSPTTSLDPSCTKHELRARQQQPRREHSQPGAVRLSRRSSRRPRR